MKIILNPENIKLLRQKGIIAESEIVTVEGDLYVAENVLSGAKRVISVGNVLNENSKRVLLG